MECVNFWKKKKRKQPRATTHYSFWRFQFTQGIIGYHEAIRTAGRYHVVCTPVDTCDSILMGVHLVQRRFVASDVPKHRELVEATAYELTEGESERACESFHISGFLNSIVTQALSLELFGLNLTLLTQPAWNCSRVS